ncbi:MAG: hypothetical protein HC913_15180 [Microscillaceae bacterium]|nr:hypothetical protein [Microscillaceae bacterium]
MTAINWNSLTKDALKQVLISKGISYDQLLDYLAAIGIEETRSSIESKLSRGTFSAKFLFQCLTAIGCNQISIPKIDSETNIISRVSEQNDGKAYSKSNLKTYFNLKNKKMYVNINSIIQMEAKEALNVISLFSGSGGLDIGLEQAGFNTVLCIENDINCRETLKYNRPQWQLFEKAEKFDYGIIKKREPGDIRDIEVNEIKEMIQDKKITLVVGGAPCQPFSNIGKRAGQQDKKKWGSFSRVCKNRKRIKS